MSTSEELYDHLQGTLSTLVSVHHIAELKNWIWVVVGILQSQSVGLSKIATYIPGETQAQARVTMIRRWLMNFHVDVWSFYEPVLEHALKDWQSEVANIILDGVMVGGGRWQILRLSLAHGQRAIPLGWVVVPGTGIPPVEKLEKMLRQVAEFLRLRVKTVNFLADRGFRDCDWAQLCQKLGWHYDIRTANNTFVTLRDGRYCRIDDLGVQPGQRRYFQEVLFTQDYKLFANLSVTWTVGDEQHAPELVAVVSDQHADRNRLREYRVRMDTEQSFRDDKSGGFDMADTHLIHAERLERLLLALAIAKLWCHELGEYVLDGGETLRRIIDPGAERALSIFQLGLRWLQRALSTNVALLPNFQAHLSPLFLPPVIHSGSQ
jgi:hypothetical protein